MTSRQQIFTIGALALLASGCNLFTSTTTADGADLSRDMHAADQGGVRDQSASTEMGSPDVPVSDLGSDVASDAASDAGDPADTATPTDIGPDGAVDMGDDWWSSTWTRRIRIDVGAVVAAQSAVPVMVLLDDARWEAQDARPDFADVRFIAADGVTELFHEIEHHPDGLFWVQLPSVRPTPSSFWLYYGNPNATSNERAAEVWDTAYVGVWHFDGLTDSTSSGNDQVSDGGTSLTTHIGDAAEFGTNIYRTVPDDPSLRSSASAFTISGWLFHDSTQLGWAAAVAREFGTGGLNDFWFGLYDNRVQLDMHLGGSNQTLRGQAVPEGVWTHVVATLDGTTRTIYVNGALDVTDTFAGAMSLTQGPVYLGADSNSGGSSQTDFFSGSFDEIRISGVARGAIWVELQHRSMTDALLTFHPVETVP